jgi:hypothetical protein
MWWTCRKEPLWLAGLFSFCVLGYAGFFNPVFAENITVDFTKPVQSISPQAFSVSESGYGYGGQQILTRDASFAQKIKLLHPGLIRIHLKYTNSGQLACGGAGCATDEPGEHWVSTIKKLGASPVVIVDNDQSHALVQDVSNAVRMVKFFNKETRNPVARWIIGNEPDNGKMDASTYSRRFNAIYDAMKREDPGIMVGGPANAYFNKSFLQTFLTRSGSRVDFLDFHQYGQGGDVKLSEQALLEKTVEYENNILTLRQMIQSMPGLSSRKIGIEIGEWNLDWSGDFKQYTPFNTVWSASVLGHILKAGGISMIYATKNGDLGLLWERSTGKGRSGFRVNAAMPIYHGMGLYTGEGLFPAFGKTMTSTVTRLPNLEIFASDKPKGLVIINKSASQVEMGRFKLIGVVNGQAEIWEKAGNAPPTAAPKRVAIVPISKGLFDYKILPYSVYRIIIKQK